MNMPGLSGSGGTGADMIDLKGFTSKALAELADREADLVHWRDVAEAKQYEHLRVMSKGAIRAAVVADVERGRVAVTITGKETKDQLVDTVAKAYAEASDAGQELAQLRRAAHADERMADRVNDLIEQAEAELIALTYDKDGQGEPVKRTPHEVAYRMGWHGDTFMTTVETATYAHRIEQAVTGGFDIREVAVSLARDAVRQIARLPHRVMHNGAHTEDLYKAAAAQEFLTVISTVYGHARLDGKDPITFEIAELT
jgi:hypothetical protein